MPRSEAGSESGPGSDVAEFSTSKIDGWLDSITEQSSSVIATTATIQELAHYIISYFSDITSSGFLDYIKRLPSDYRTTFLHHFSKDLLNTKINTETNIVIFLDLLTPLDAFYYLLCQINHDTLHTMNIDRILTIENIQCLVPSYFLASFKIYLQKDNTDLSRTGSEAISINYHVTRLRTRISWCEQYLLSDASSFAKIIAVLHFLRGADPEDADHAGDFSLPDTTISERYAFIDSLSIEILNCINSIFELTMILNFVSPEEKFILLRNLITKIPSALINKIFPSFDAVAKVISMLPTYTSIRLLILLQENSLDLQPRSSAEIVLLFKALNPSYWKELNRIYDGCIDIICRNVDRLRELVFGIIDIPNGVKSLITIIGYPKLAREIIKRPLDLQSLYEPCTSIEQALILTSVLDPEPEPEPTLDASDVWSIWRVIQTKNDALIWFEKFQFDKSEFSSKLSPKFVELFINSFDDLVWVLKDYIIINTKNLVEFTQTLLETGKFALLVTNKNNLEILINTLPSEDRGLFLSCIPKGFIDSLLIATTTPGDKKVVIEARSIATFTPPTAEQINTIYTTLITLPNASITPAELIATVQPLRRVLASNSRLLSPDVIFITDLVDTKTPDAADLSLTVSTESFERRAAAAAACAVRLGRDVVVTAMPIFQRGGVMAWRYRDIIGQGVSEFLLPRAYRAALTAAQLASQAYCKTRPA